MASTTEVNSNFDIPRAHLVYTRDNGKRQVTYVPPREESTDKESNVIVEQFVRDARRVRPSPTFAEHGFQLVVHDTALSKQDFYKNPGEKIEKVYYKEVCDAIKKVCPGAAEVKAFHHMVRKAPVSASQGSGGRPQVRRQVSNVDHAHGTVGQPAGCVHCDYTVRNAINLFDGMAKAEYRKGRYAVINAWRNISEAAPIQNDHLAMCDARTIVAPDDFVQCDVVQDGKVNETYRLDPGQKGFHEWYYYPNMVKKEMLIFMQYDSNSRTKTRYTFHTSLRSPHAPKDAPPRESVECRCIAFFPKHEPNTIPEIIYKDNEIVSVATFKILQALMFASKWPQHGQIWMRTELYKEGGVERVVNALVNGGAQCKEHGLEKATQEQRDEIINRLLSDSTFEETAKSYFLPMDIEVSVIASIMSSLDHTKSWPENAKKWWKTTLHKPRGVEQVVREVVTGGAVRGEHGLKGTTKDQQESIIKKLLRNKDFEKKAKAAFPK